MSLNPHISRRRRNLSPEINPIAEIGRRNIGLSVQQSTLRRNFSDSTSSPFSPLPIVHKMESSGGSGGTGGDSSSQPSTDGMFYRQRMLVIDGKYINDDGLSTTTMISSAVIIGEEQQP
jgi:hypothetical protein